MTMTPDHNPILAMLATAAAAILSYGLRTDLAAGRFEPMFLIANGLFLLLGLAAASSVVAMASPQVGNQHGGWKWAAAMAGLLPASAIVILLSRPIGLGTAIFHPSDLVCIANGIALGLLTAVPLTWWLRRGAPTSPERAGLLVGLASGSIGIFAFGFHCPIDALTHAGLAHAVPVVGSALLGRLIIPPLVRW